MTDLRTTITRLLSNMGSTREIQLYLRRFTQVDGGVALDLDAHPLHRTFLTRSTWRDEATMDAFTADPLHREVMRTFRTRMAASNFHTSHSLVGESEREQERPPRR